MAKHTMDLVYAPDISQHYVQCCCGWWAELIDGSSEELLAVIGIHRAEARKASSSSSEIPADNEDGAWWVS